jgi:hypothetical protein
MCYCVLTLKTESSLAADEVDRVQFMKSFAETLSSIQKCLGNEFSVLAGTAHKCMCIVVCVCATRDV